MTASDSASPLLLSPAAAWLTAACTLLLMFGPNYLGWPVPAVPAWLFLIAFTGYRAAIALTLQRGARRQPSTDKGERQ